MIPKEALKMMGDAAFKLRAALVLLDRSETACQHCTRVTYNNYEHVQLGRTLEAMANKLENQMKSNSKQEEEGS